MEHLALLADSPAGGHGEGHLCLLPAGKPCHDLHVTVLSTLHVKLAACQDLCPVDY